MRRWLPVFVIFLLALAGVWFWSLGSLPEEVSGKIVLTEAEGQVSIKGPDASDYVLVKQGVEIAEGSSIRTGSDAAATVSWFGDAESRIGSDSEIKLISASTDEEQGTALRIRLEAGRMWSRVMRVLDLGADVTVETNDVVATVRGTSFDMEKKMAQPTKIWVADSVVEASGASVAAKKDGFFVAEGNMASFGGSGQTTAVQPLTDSDKDSEWFKTNHQADAVFRTNKLKRITESLAVDHVPLTGLLHDITEASETVRERFVDAPKRQRFATRILLRRLAVVRRTIEEGKSGLGFQEFSRLDGQFKARIAAGPEAVKTIRPAVLMAQVLYFDVRPSDPAYRVKQQLESWLPLVARTPADALSARLLSIDARLDEAVAEVDASSFDQAGQMIILARQGLTNSDREIREAKGADANALGRLRRMWKALSVRADVLDARLKTALAPPAALPTILIEDSVPTSSVPVVPPVVTSTIPVAPIQIPKPVSLQIQPAQSSVVFGKTVSFRAIVVYDTGLTKDVTKLTTFKASPTGYGALNGSVFTASQLQGTVVFIAGYVEDGRTLEGSATVTISQ
ncbi:MAG: FecR domain-containing protein [Candidatus Uhrbacteria bacterium]